MYLVQDIDSFHYFYLAIDYQLPLEERKNKAHEYCIGEASDRLIRLAMGG